MHTGMEFLSVVSFFEAQTDAWVASELGIAAVGAQRSGLCSCHECSIHCYVQINQRES